MGGCGGERMGLVIMEDDATQPFTTTEASTKALSRPNIAR